MKKFILLSSNRNLKVKIVFIIILLASTLKAEEFPYGFRCPFGWTVSDYYDIYNPSGQPHLNELNSGDVFVMQKGLGSTLAPNVTEGTGDGPLTASNNNVQIITEQVNLVTYRFLYANAAGYDTITYAVDGCDVITLYVTVEDVFYSDADNDGFGDPNNTTLAVTAPPGFVANNTDCDPSDGTKWRTGVVYQDGDGDGYANGTTLNVCYGTTLTAPQGYVVTSKGLDCDDADPNVFISGKVYIDIDGDGYDNGNTILCHGSVAPPGYSLTTKGHDCDDTDPNVFIYGPVYIDNDGDGYDSGLVTTSCHGAVPPPGYSYTTLGPDCNDHDNTVHSPQTYYKDADGDGWGDINNPITVCSSTPPKGYVTNSLDCNDNNASVPTFYYPDADGDGYGYDMNKDPGNHCYAWIFDPNSGQVTVFLIGGRGCSINPPAAPVFSCLSTPPQGYSTNSSDCNDNDSTIHPRTFYRDADIDRFGDPGNSTVVCSSATPPAGYVTDNTDCNDNDPTVHSPITYYRDADGDGYGNPAVTKTVCSSTPPAGYVSNKLDCNDNDPAISPAAVEVCGNKVDDNCNGLVDEKTCYPCQNGTNLTTTNITSNSAQVNWTATANPQQWQLEYKTTATGSQWIDVFLTGNIRSANLTSLKSKQAYNWHLRAKCNGIWTAYSTAIAFTTLANGAIVSSSTATTLDNPTLKLYPNPNKGNFLVELNVLDKINADATIQLIDMTGKTVQMEMARINNGSLQKTIRVSPVLAEGLYMVRILVNDTVYKTQIIYAK